MVICKLRSETTERHRQHWRAAKALLVIFPLLGISYIITLVGPTDTHRVFQYVRALLLSLQVGWYTKVFKSGFFFMFCALYRMVCKTSKKNLQKKNECTKCKATFNCLFGENDNLHFSIFKTKKYILLTIMTILT